MNTYMANAQTIKRKWHLIDASDKVLGRLAAKIASLLRGKCKAEYTPHADTGDFVVVTYVEKLRVTGNKAQQKNYYRHSGYPGGIKQESFEDLHARIPGRVLEHAVRGMLPKGPLGRQMFRKLKIYVGGEHPHEAQKPKNYDEI